MDNRQINKAQKNASDIARDDRMYRGRRGVARTRQARAKVDARRADRRACKAIAKAQEE